MHNMYGLNNISQGSWKVQLRQKLKNMRRPADCGQKRAHKETESTESLDEGTSLPFAKQKCTEDY